MKALVLSILMGIRILCPFMQVGEVVSFNHGYVVYNVDGEIYERHLENWYLEAGDKVLLLDYEIVEVLD